MTPMAPTRPTSPTSLAANALPADDAGTPTRLGSGQHQEHWLPLPMSARQCHIPIMANPAAAAAARSVVEEAIRTWRVPVDADVAVLLTSELVTNAVTHGTATAGTFVLLTIACDAAGLRVDVHDGSGNLPVLDTGLLDTDPSGSAGPAETETGRGLLLVTALSAEWGFYRTPAGKAVYFTLELQPRSSQADIQRFEVT
jgi:anti-sigma regulatory factor (Ser/Thr protein kinase)